MWASWGVHDLPLFVAAGLLLNLTPGADVLYVAGQAASGGRRAGLLAALGIGAGCLVHVLLAAVGVSALLASSAWAFNLLKWAGAAYLTWMGLAMLWASRRPTPLTDTALSSGTSDAPDVAPTSPGLNVRAGREVFWRGALTNALNPKVALFFLAFLPQFIRADAPHQWLAFLLLGVIFTVNGTLVTAALGWLAGTLRERWADRGRGGLAAVWLPRAAGLVFVGLGVKLALSSR